MIRKNYKELSAFCTMHNKRGQLAIFIIIALAILGIILVIFLFRPVTPPQPVVAPSPEKILRDCIEPEIAPVLAQMSAHGGSLNPDNASVIYRGEKIPYLCYTSDYYQPCVVQQPMIVDHVEKELLAVMKPKADTCLQKFKDEYAKQGYSISGSGLSINISIIPHTIEFEFISPMTITKDTTRNYREFKVGVPSEMYDLFMIAGDVIQYEAIYGDSQTNTFISIYPDLSINKIRVGDGSKVYILRNVVTNENFTFATRGLTFPPGEQGFTK